MQHRIIRNASLEAMDDMLAIHSYYLCGGHRPLRGGADDIQDRRHSGQLTAPSEMVEIVLGREGGGSVCMWHWVTRCGSLVAIDNALATYLLNSQ
jgi:hypothetical protein